MSPVLKIGTSDLSGAAPGIYGVNSPRGRLAVFQNDTTAWSIDRNPELGKHSIAEQTAFAGEYLLIVHSDLNPTQAVAA